jgi:hypothetical protein
MERATGIEPAPPAWESKLPPLYLHNLQNRSRKMYVHATHTVHALPDLRVAGGRFGGRFDHCFLIGAFDSSLISPHKEPSLWIGRNIMKRGEERLARASALLSAGEVQNPKSALAIIAAMGSGAGFLVVFRRADDGNRRAHFTKLNLQTARCDNSPGADGRSVWPDLVRRRSFPGWAKSPSGGIFLDTHLRLRSIATRWKAGPSWFQSARSYICAILFASLN